MDVNTMRTIITVMLFVVFLGIVWWAFSARNKARFEKDAQLPFADDDR